MSKEVCVIDTMRADDWNAVRTIYLEGIATGNATFETDVPSWEKWDQSHVAAPRLVARNGDVVQVDARPSDSIAIALRLSAPIFASEQLLTDVQVEETESYEPEKIQDAAELNAEQLKEYLERLRPEDFGKFNL